MSKQTQLDALAKRITQDNVTPKLAAGATQLVLGEGTADADVVFIGEAPGAEEDKQGLPFVGAAGKFLNEMLGSIGTGRGDVYITNIVKYRPPNNRDPEPEEIKEFLPYLVEQIEIIQPKVIATLGRFSMSIFLPEARISQIHGQPKKIKIKLGSTERRGADAMQGAGEERKEDVHKGTANEHRNQATKQRAANASGAASSAGGQASMSVVVLPLYHPAAALYNGSMRETLLADFARLPKILDQIEPKAQSNKPKSKEKTTK